LSDDMKSKDDGFYRLMQWVIIGIGVGWSAVCVLVGYLLGKMT